MDDSLKNGVPVLDRTMEILGVLERQPAGTSIRELTTALGLPRSTVYRVLNTLLAHQMVRRSAEGLFSLGPRLVALAARVRQESGSYDLAELALGPMQQVRDDLGEPIKFSVRDGDRAKVIVALLGHHEYSPAPSTGTSYPLHAGAASKVIMAYLSPEDLERHLSAPLTRYTPRTITDPDKLRSHLARIRRDQFAADMGEHNLNVHALAAPVFDSSGRFLGALSIPFLSDKDEALRERMQHRLREAALAITARLPRS